TFTCMARPTANLWACRCPMAACACATATCWTCSNACRCTARYGSTRPPAPSGLPWLSNEGFPMTASLQGSLMVGIAGEWLAAEDRHLLRQPEVAGLIIFARNIASPRQVRELCASIRAIRPDLILAVDQEGGRVQRLRRGFVRLPAMRAIADNANAEYLAEQCGWLMATEVLAVGLDLSFAPVLDLDHQRSAVVGSRAFEGDPQRATQLAGAFIRGMNAAGM